MNQCTSQDGLDLSRIYTLINHYQADQTFMLHKFYELIHIFSYCCIHFLLCIRFSPIIEERKSFISSVLFCHQYCYLMYKEESSFNICFYNVLRDILTTVLPMPYSFLV